MQDYDVALEDIESYLLESGWRITNAGPLAEIWSFIEDEQFKVCVPKIPTAPDFHRVLKKLVGDIAVIEDRSSSDVYEDILKRKLSANSVDEFLYLLSLNPDNFEGSHVVQTLINKYKESKENRNWLTCTVLENIMKELTDPFTNHPREKN